MINDDEESNGGDMKIHGGVCQLLSHSIICYHIQSVVIIFNQKLNQISSDGNNFAPCFVSGEQ